MYVCMFVHAGSALVRPCRKPAAQTVLDGKHQLGSNIGLINEADGYPEHDGLSLQKAVQHMQQQSTKADICSCRQVLICGLQLVQI